VHSALSGALGIAARAGLVVTGTEQVRHAVRDGAVALVVFAGDASHTQRRKLEPLVEAKGVPTLTLASREDLGRAVGRAPLSAVGITSEGLAVRVRELADAHIDGPTAK
jgi:ribosomal protein L7Ae-like RNA K-turn-binding protein